MTFADKLEAVYQAGYYSLVKDKYGQFSIFSTKDRDGDLRRSGWLESPKKAMQFLGSHHGIRKEELNQLATEENWEIIAQIHPSELMGPGLQPGQKVKVKENAKEEFEKKNLDWTPGKNEMVGKVCEVNCYFGSDYGLYSADKSEWWVFPPTTLELVFDEIQEINGKKYRLSDVLERISNLKEV